MNERSVESVTPIAETDWEEAECMDSECEGEREFVLALEYEDEPGKTFYSVLCRPCTAEYTKKHDIATIVGE